MSGLKRLIILLSAVISLCLIWRVWPHSASGVLPFGGDSAARFSVFASIRQDENDLSTAGTFYRMDDIAKSESALWKELSDILAASRYRQNFRNLLPWKAPEIPVSHAYGGSTVRVVCHFGSGADNYAAISFISPDFVAVSFNEGSGYRFYHPTNPETLSMLADFVLTYGRIG